MLKMQVIMDNEKIHQEKVYKADKIQRAIDNLLLFEYGFAKSEDGFYFESGSSEDYTNFWSAILLLKDEEWFLNNIKTWLWFNSDDSDNPEDFAIEDLREHYTKRKKSA